MNAERWRQIDELFQEALDVAPDERTSFVHGRSPDDTELVREVLSLLRAERRVEAFLDRPARGGVSELMSLDTADDDLVDLAGRRLGAYRLRSLIATGGMGAVYLAARDDDQYRKEVAIKLVRRTGAGSSTAWRDDLERRFQLERQVLASLEHPNIARLIDGGTTEDGRPYFVMEHVDGRPIDVYCDDRTLSIRDRLELFCHVCDAVQHAHQNLVLHRDLKPGNILVTLDGTPKLLDFGLAKLLDPHQAHLAGEPTATGAFMGTFAYAAPEQVAETAGPHDTRSDVYALGLILYRLLAGRPAYRVEGSITDMLRIITETQPAPPSRFGRAIGNELDTIVLTAIAKEQPRRYQSAGALAADLRRYLAGDAILAKSDSRMYVLRKTVRRYRVPLSVAVVGLLLLSVFAAVVSVQSRQLAHRGAELAATLRAANIDRGRLMGLSGDAMRAEQLIWPEHLAIEPITGDGTNTRHSGDRLSHWALWELYAQHPCVRTVVHDERGTSDLRLCVGEATCIMTGVDDAGPALVDLTTGTRLATLDAGQRIPSLAISADGTVAAAGTTDGHAIVWDTRSGRELVRFRSAVGGTRVVTALTPDGSVIACGESSRIVVRSVTDGSTIASVDLGEVEPIEVAFTPDVTRLLVSADDVLQSWDWRTGGLIREWPGPCRVPAVLAISPDSRYVARADRGGTNVDVIDLETGEAIARLLAAQGFVSSLDFHPHRIDRPWIAVGSVDRTVRIWEIPGPRLVASIRGHDDPRMLARFTRDGQHLVTAGRDGMIRYWESSPWRCLTLWEQTSTVFNARFSPDGRTIAACYGDDAPFVRLLDAATGDERHMLRGHDADVSSVSFSPDGRTLASASYDGSVRFWSLDDPDAVVVTPPEGKINSLAFSPDGLRVVTARDGMEIQVLDRHTGDVEKRFTIRPAGPEEPGGERIPSVDWSPDGRMIALAMYPRTSTVLLDVESGSQRTLLGHERRLRIVRFNHDGSLLASAGDDGTIRLWPVDGGPPKLLEGHQQGLFAIDFSPDGQLLASAGRSGRIKLWDVATGHELATLVGHDEIVFAVDFSPDGTRLISGGRDRTIGVWDLTYYDRHIAGNAGVFGGGS